MTQQQQRLHQANMQARINAVGAALDRLAHQRRERDGREPVRWQVREPERSPLAWRLAA
ncbi:hypothetical protein [Lamprobacter modestohalophilus]|uniref:hypothetical protein n=1 Tax=Lamprobacter modestohalophilus TaxID=1064514 RepID=UPI001907A22D|nr:hypothetical protein [Lamprobacter modestohalophilus]